MNKFTLPKRFTITKFDYTDSNQPNTDGSDTIFIQIYMDVPPGVLGVSKNQIFFTKKLLSSFAKIEPELGKPQKTVKIENKSSKNNVF